MADGIGHRFIAVIGSGLLLFKTVPEEDGIIQSYAQLKDRCPASTHAKMVDAIERIPERDTFVHGDVHSNNIMVEGGHLVLIDMGAARCGHPIFDLMSVGLMPLSRAAPSLMPTDWMYSRRLVTLKIRNSISPIRITAKIGVGTGMPGMVFPMALMMPLLSCGVASPLIQ